MSREAIDAVLRTLPTLTQFGMSVVLRGRGGLSPAEYDRSLRASQECLLADVTTFHWVCDWLTGIAPRKQMAYGSYRLKHLCEKCLGMYVANGTFIAAAVHCGFPYQVIPYDPNVLFGMSKRSIHAEERRHA